MRKIIMILLVFVQVFAMAQDNIITSQYTIIDKITKRYSSLFASDVSEITFNLVKLNIDSTVIYGIEITVFNADTKTSLNSISLTNFSGKFGADVNLSYQRFEKDGFIFLNSEKTDKIINFLNASIKKFSPNTTNYTLHKLSVNNNFEIGFFYDYYSTTQEWKLFINVNNAVFQTTFSEGLDLLRKFNEFKKYIAEKK